MEKEPQPRFTIEALSAATIDDAIEMRLQSWLDTYINDDAGVTQDWIEAHNQEQRTDARRQARLARLDDPQTAGWIAMDQQGTVVGATTPYIDQDGRQHVGSLYVDKAWHGQGVAGALMQRVVDWCDPEKPIELGVVTYNDRAKAFYRKWGFEEVLGSEKLFAGMIPEIQMVRPPRSL